MDDATRLARHVGRWDNYRENQLTHNYLRHLEPLSLYRQVEYAMNYLNDAITKALSPHGITYYDDKSFSEKTSAARIQSILTEQQYQECELLEDVRTVFYQRPDATFDNHIIAAKCSKLELFNKSFVESDDNRLKFMTSAQIVANDTFHRWVI